MANKIAPKNIALKKSAARFGAKKAAMASSKGGAMANPLAETHTQIPVVIDRGVALILPLCVVLSPGH